MAGSAEKDAAEWQRNANAGELRWSYLQWFVFGVHTVAVYLNVVIQGYITGSSRKRTL